MGAEVVELEVTIGGGFGTTELTTFPEFEVLPVTFCAFCCCDIRRIGTSENLDLLAGCCC